MAKTTKIIKIGEVNESVKKLTPIVFTHWIKDDFTVEEKIGANPSDFNFIELITKNFGSNNEDLMYCYNNENRRGYLIAGHFNDGVV